MTSSGRELPGGRPRLARPGLLGMILAPRVDPRLNRTADIIGAFAALLGLGLSISSTVYQWERHQMTLRDSWIIGVLLPLISSTSAWIVVRVVRRRSARTALVVHTCLCLVGVLIGAMFWQATAGQSSPSLAHSAELGAAAAWTCFSWPMACADITATIVFGGMVMAGTDAMGSLSWANSAYYGAIGVVATMSWTAVVSAVQMARTASIASSRSMDALIRAEEALAESNRWDAIIHDTVLNALGTAARATTDAVAGPARILARKAVDAVHRTAPRTRVEPLADHVARVAADLGLDATIEVRGTPMGEIDECFQRAASEAVTNVARHAGVTKVRVTGRFEAAGAELVICDEGRGFDPAAVPENRHGLRGSVLATLEACGGRAEILTAPGRGTTVRLSWRPPATEAIEMDRLPPFRAMVAFFVVALAISLSLGVPCSPYVIRWSIEDAGLALLVLCVVGAMAWPKLSTAKTVLLAVVTVAAQTAMLGNLRMTDEVGWQEWFVGFSLGVFTPLAWRTRERRWCLVAGLSWPAVTIGGALLGGYDPLLMLYSRASSFTFPVVMSMAAAWASKSMDDSLETVRASHARTLRSMRRRARAEVVRLETGRRLRTIEGAPLEMIEALAGGAPITDAVRRECTLLEASTRDLLVAPYVVDDEMRAQFRRARERGATVVITGSEGIDADHAVTARAFQDVCVLLARETGPGQAMTCRWHPASALGAATVARSGGTGRGTDARGLRERIKALASGCGVELIDEGADIMVTLRSGGTGGTGAAGGGTGGHDEPTTSAPGELAPE